MEIICTGEIEPFEADDDNDDDVEEIREVIRRMLTSDVEGCEA